MSNKKDLYIDNSLILNTTGDNLFDDIYIEYNSLPEINFDDIDTSVEFLGKKISFPLIINSMTGGTEKGLEINEILFTLAHELDIVLGVGSQEEEIDDEELSLFFLGDMNDDINENTIILSNLSARAKKEDVKKAMDKIHSKGICLYLNPAQEAVSYDGNKDFTGVLENIEEIVKEYGDKVIVKEKGMGMNKATIKKLVNAGVKNIDVSGYGGTNFIEMENLRNYRNDFSELYNWGIPTAKSILDAREVSKDIKIISSGGIKTGLEVAKSIIIGADYVGVSGELLRYLLHGGYEQAKKYIEDLMYKTKIVMFLLGVKNIEELKKVDYKIIGKLKELMEK